MCGFFICATENEKLLQLAKICAIVLAWAARCVRRNWRCIMALEIQLVALGHRERGEPDKIWVEAKGNSRYCLSTLLENFWLAAKPENADGPAIAVRFV